MRALVDTGADATVIPEDVAEELELHVIEYASLEGVVGSHDVTVHGAIVHLAGVALPLGIVAHADECVVGRDLLTHFVTRLDGPRATVTFEVRPQRGRPPRTRR
ncbi:MAG: retroviral-like aspartic protease family protein [Labilithrix sp.]|nr:retroviral-like aspartic protease family protein [Labilithrix sp.]MCW5815089.1 retroviral-like aspartic protease family protein [Labilithrix sp.]